jgi:hypothetical protein
MIRKSNDCGFDATSWLIYSRWLYTRVFVIDGNFTAVHLRQKNPETDVFLSDGTGYMTRREPYLKHLNAAKDWIEVSPTRTSCRK